MPVQKQFKKNNHWVPKLYLKRWSADGVTIPTYRLLVAAESAPIWKKQSLKGIAYHEHLYTYYVGDEATDEFEDWLEAEFEQPGALAIDRAVGEQPMTAGDWRDLVRFAVAQDVRTPARLNEFIEKQKAHLPTLMQDTLEGLKKLLESGAPLPRKQAGVDTTGFPLKVSSQPTDDGDTIIKAEVVVGRLLWLWQQRLLLTETIEKLPTTGWTIIKAPSGISWPTSDDPLIRLNYYGPGNYEFCGGWGVPNGDIFVPLSPKHLLHTCIKKKPLPRNTVLDTSTALEFRRMIIEHAHRYVFATDPGDIHMIRPRTVSLEKSKEEATAWKNWHIEQSNAEINLSKKP